MSRFVVNPLPNPPTVVFRAGGGRERIKIEVLTNGGTVWFSDDINQLLNLKQDGNPGGWFLTGGAPPQDRTDIWIDNDLFATTAAIATEIEVAQLVHVSANASYTSDKVYSDPLTPSQVLGYDQAINAPIGQQVSDALSAFFAPLRNLFGVFLLALIFSSVSYAQSPLSLTPGLNVVWNTGLLTNQTFVWNEPVNATSESIIILEGGGSPTTAQVLISDVSANVDPARVFGNFIPDTSQLTPPCRFGQPFNGSYIGSATNSSLLVLTTGSPILVQCKPSTSGLRQFIVSLTSTQPVQILVDVSINNTDDTQLQKSWLSSIASTCAINSADGEFAVCSPTQLGVNALTLPGSGTTALSNIIDTRGVKQASLFATCTQAATANIAVYAEDGITQLFTFSISGTAGTTIDAFIGSEHNIFGFPALSATEEFAFPERALAFSFTNGGAVAGTCTARLFLAY